MSRVNEPTVDSIPDEDEVLVCSDCNHRLEDGGFCSYCDKIHHYSEMEFEYDLDPK